MVSDEKGARNMKIMSLFACGIVVGTAPEASCEPRRPQMCEACMCHMILLQSCFGRHFIIVGSRLLPARCLMNTIGTGKLPTSIQLCKPGIQMPGCCLLYAQVFKFAVLAKLLFSGFKA